MDWDVGKALARLRDEYRDVTETSRANPDAVMAPDGRYFTAETPARAQDWAWRVLPAIDLGIRDEHDLGLVLTALGWTESSPAWGRVMGWEERDTDPGAMVVPVGTTVLPGPPLRFTMRRGEFGDDSDPS